MCGFDPLKGFTWGLGSRRGMTARPCTSSSTSGWTLLSVLLFPHLHSR